jgi:methylated-DNA-protein-cysteine methyltransferase-like protein
MPLSFPQRIYRLVARIPRGRVATYGQLARLAGFPRRARQVGYALAALPNGTVLPWQRVINAKGEVSRRRRFGAELTQRMLLEREGVRFDGRGRVALSRFQWSPRRRAKTG